MSSALVWYFYLYLNYYTPTPLYESVQLNSGEFQQVSELLDESERAHLDKKLLKAYKALDDDIDLYYTLHFSSKLTEQQLNILGLDALNKEDTKVAENEILEIAQNGWQRYVKKRIKNTRSRL